MALASPAHKRDYPAYIGAITGAYIQDEWPAGSLVALSTAGSTPFFAPRMRYIDMLGLNDRTIGKRTDFDLVTERQRLAGPRTRATAATCSSASPTTSFWGQPKACRCTRPWFLSDAELASSPEFARCYEAKRVEIPYQVDEAARLEVVNPAAVRLLLQDLPEGGAAECA